MSSPYIRPIHHPKPAMSGGFIDSLSLMTGLSQEAVFNILIIVLLIMLYFFIGIITRDKMDNPRYNTETERNIARDESINSSFRDRFMNSRETPYFDSVSNDTLRREEREEAAVRVLGKINQERLRRKAERDADVMPVPWEQHWDDWQKQNPL